MDLVRDVRLERVSLKVMAENADARHLFSPEMFSTVAHLIVYEQIKRAQDDGVILDKNLLVSYLEGDDKYAQVGESLIQDIFSSEYYGDFIGEYAKKLSRYSLYRKTQLGLFSLADEINKHDVADLISELDLIRNNVFDEVDVSDKDNSLEVLLEEELTAIFDNNSTQHVKTGFDDFDTLIGGFEYGDLAIIAARPSVGKTSLMLRWMINFAKDGVKSEIYSFEMSSPQAVKRILSMESGIPTHRLRDGFLSDEEKSKLKSLVSQLKHIPLSFRYSIGHQLSELCNQIRLSNKVNGTRVFGVDYVQLMQLTPGQETQSLYKIASTLKGLALELDSVILLVSQLNRGVEARKDKHPMLSDLRQSGGLEESADKVIFPYREFYYSRSSEDLGLAELIVAKNRNGPLANFSLMFDEETTNFWV